MKVLLMAYECSPYRGSEWAVGWGRLLQAVRCAETHVITSEANFRDLARARQEGLLPSDAFFYKVEPDAKLNRLEQRPGLYDYNYAAYKHWHRLAFTLAEQLHAEHEFTVVHQSTVCTFREPGYTWKLGIPFVWGPVGGTQNFPARMLPMLPWRHAAKEAVRGVLNRIAIRDNARVRAAATTAAAVLGANSTNRRDFAQTFDRPVQQLLETGLNTVTEPDRARFHERITDAEINLYPRPLKLLWSGQLTSRKALPVLLRALAKLKDNVDFHLDVLGEGPMADRWMAESSRLGLNARVNFRGSLPFVQAVAEMNKADLLCFTSLRDTSGNVVLEALAAGVPVLCFDHQGAADMVSDTCGVKIPVTNPKRSILAWATAIQTLSEDPQLLLQLSEGATEQARRFLWSSNGDRINAIYRRVARAPLEDRVADMVEAVAS